MPAFFETLRTGACSKWVKQSKWSKFLTAAALSCGIMMGIAASSVLITFNRVTEPKKIAVVDSNVDYDPVMRELSVKIINSYVPGCNKSTFHSLVAPDLDKDGYRQYYVLSSTVGGKDFTLSEPKYQMHLEVPRYIPNGKYNYILRTLFLCDLYGVTVTHSTETKPVEINIQ